MSIERACDHAFFPVGENKYDTDIVCAYCGQVRVLNTEGKVKIVVERGEIVKLTSHGHFDS